VTRHRARRRPSKSLSVFANPDLQATAPTRRSRDPGNTAGDVALRRDLEGPGADEPIVSATQTSPVGGQTCLA
jgi:hypothetical protein